MRRLDGGRLAAAAVVVVAAIASACGVPAGPSGFPMDPDVELPPLDAPTAP